MIQNLFFIRFRGQLRRTKPELIESLEKTVTGAIAAAGGSAETGRRLLSASFTEDRIGFWLDMLILIEKVHSALEKASGELYGYFFLLGNFVPDIKPENLCRALSGKMGKRFTGIWCSREVREALKPYLVFDSAGANTNESNARDYLELKEWKSPGTGAREYPCGDEIEKILAAGDSKNTLFLGPRYAGKRDGIYRYCAGISDDVPPLVVSFGLGGKALNSFADALTPRIQSFLEAALSVESLKELTSTGNALFRERLRDEWSPFLVDLGRGFIKLLLSAYISAAKYFPPRKDPAGKYLPAGVLVLEEPSLADSDSAKIFRDVFCSLGEKDDLLILAADSLSADSPSAPSALSAQALIQNGGLESWNGIFLRVVNFFGKNPPAPEKIDFPAELWELSYIIHLLGRYFPAYLFPRLFEEEGLNGEIYFRGLEMLESFGVFSSGNPKAEISGFLQRAEKIPGRRKDKIRSAVRNRLLAWTKLNLLCPCFNLLVILYELGERADDELALRAVKADVLNGTYGGIEESIRDGSFVRLAGKGSAPVLKYIYKTLKVLVWDGKKEIQNAFEEPVPSFIVENDKPCHRALRAQIYTNLAAFYAGSKSNDEASEAVREAMHLNKSLGENSVPAYRLFSLVNLSRQRLDDALEYISFAVEHAERPAQKDELIITSYFAASINFLHGNLSKAEQFAEKAEKAAVLLGRSSWGCRAAFLRGRSRFETGLYDEALVIFESLDHFFAESGGQVFRNDAERLAAEGTVRAWIYRTKVFLGRPANDEDEKKSSCRDMEIFRIEAAYFRADYEVALLLAEKYLAANDENTADVFLFTEQPDWRSGFSQCEYMFQPEKSSGARLVWVYGAMARCALPFAREEKVEVLGAMQRFMREEILPDTDPGDSFFFYAWYSMQKNSGASLVDMHTAASMAHKRLQRRAARIGNPDTRRAFLSQSRWNSVLIAAAREFKLT